MIDMPAAFSLRQGDNVDPVLVQHCLAITQKARGGVSCTATWGTHDLTDLQWYSSMLRMPHASYLLRDNTS